MNLRNKIRGRPTNAFKAVSGYANKDKFTAITEIVWNKIKRELNTESVIIEKNPFSMTFGIKIK